MKNLSVILYQFRRACRERCRPLEKCRRCLWQSADGHYCTHERIFDGIARARQGKRCRIFQEKHPKAERAGVLIAERLSEQRQAAIVRGDWETVDQVTPALRQHQRQHTDTVFEAARAYAAHRGMELKRCTAWHYQLIVNTWIYNLYPTNHRIYIDPKRRGPFLKVKRDWSFGDVIDAAADKIGKR